MSRLARDFVHVTQSVIRYLPLVHTKNINYRLTWLYIFQRRRPFTSWMPGNPTTCPPGNLYAYTNRQHPVRLA